MRSPLILVGSLTVASLLSTALARAQDETETQVEAELEAEAFDSTWRRPLASRNQIPISLLFVYMTADRAGAIPRGQTDFELAFDYSNVILSAEDETEAIRLDLEYLRTLVALKHGLGGGLELGASIPFYVYYGGFLDPLVDAFHEAFGFPNFLRSQTPHGLVDFQYRRGDVVVFSGQSAFGAVGDVSLEAKKSLVDAEGVGLALRGALKLPTGDLDTLSGSGATDFAAGVAFDRVGRKLGVFFNANYHFLGQGEKLRTRDFFSFMAGADWRFKPRVVALLQADYARPSIEGGLPFLNRAAAQVALGLRFRYSDRFVYEWRLVEDLSNVSPDFTFAFQVGVRFPRTAR